VRLRELRGKNVLVWGYGIEGKVMVDFLLKNKATDKILVATSDKVSETRDNVEFILETDILKNDDIDVIIKSPGVSYYKSEIKILEDRGVLITSMLNILLAEAAKYKNLKIIGVTGTKGKSTSVSVLNHMLNNLNHKSVALGNIGVPFISVIEKLDDYDYLVLELSSYQIKNLAFDVDYAVILNLFPEHIGWHLSHENYFRDKLSILNHSRETILNYGNKTTVEYMAKEKRGGNCIYFNTAVGFSVEDGCILNCGRKILDTKTLNNIRGEHIFMNICALLTILEKENIDPQLALNTLKTFKCLNHRLEVFYEDRDKNTIFVDDSISTVPESTIEALKTFSTDEIFLILGGFDRQQNFDELLDFIEKNKNVKKIFLLGQTGRRLSVQLGGEKSAFFETMEDLILAIKNHDLIGKTVLLSPASPSYDMFKNFEERGNRFKNLML
jgi:UDP-N-acetylmuramoylalanine--D-glutamate ligase